MEQQVKAVAILNIIWGGLGVLGALFVLVFFGGMAGLVSADHDTDAATGAIALGAIGAVAFIVITLVSVPTLIGGIGLLKYREWARILTIVMSALHLLSIPLGTALGVYGIWVLTKDETRALFKTKTLSDSMAPAR
jgi:predicted ferric reductase